MIPALMVAGFGMMLWSSMLRRGAAQSWMAEDVTAHDWQPDGDRSAFSRLAGFFAGPPAFLCMVLLAIRSYGWWTIAILLAAVPFAFVCSALLLGGSREQVARRMRTVRLPVTLAAIGLTLLAGALAPL